jgi:hypothetical protein
MSKKLIRLNILQEISFLLDYSFMCNLEENLHSVVQKMEQNSSIMTDFVVSRGHLINRAFDLGLSSAINNTNDYSSIRRILDIVRKGDTGKYKNFPPPVITILYNFASRLDSGCFDVLVEYCGEHNLAKGFLIEVVRTFGLKHFDISNYTLSHKPFHSRVEKILPFLDVVPANEYLDIFRYLVRIDHRTLQEVEEKCLTDLIVGVYVRLPKDKQKYSMEILKTNLGEFNVERFKDRFEALHGDGNKVLPKRKM